ncbi:MAG: PAS domain S-box protein [Firmicutes bacterium]|nr:PAS domain S-box protein [Bacillota bacterium]
MAKGFIERSHRRCREMGVDFTRIYSSLVLEGAELRRRLEDCQELMEIAAPFMEQLLDFVRGSNFLVILTDAEGIILKIIGDEEILNDAHNLKMIPGASMNERHIGTNAMGTGLVEGKPIQVTGKEHFVSAYHRWTCSVSPIRNPQGKIIGTLDLTGNIPLVHSHTLGMVVAAAHAIESMLANKLAHNKLLVASKYIQTIVDSIDAGIFTVGARGYMKTLSKKAEQMLGFTQQEVVGMRVENFIEGWDSIKETLTREQTYYEEEDFVRGRSGKLHCTLSIYYIIDDEHGHHQGYVCVIKDIQKIRKLVDRISGKQSFYTFDSIIGRDSKFLKAVRFARQIADGPSTVLITGESGTGKEVFAQSIHNASSRRDEPFVAVNCGALPRNLIESELFGYAEGAFTGAKRGGKPGKFELADGGTLFLDEIGEMPLDMQANLLRVLEEGRLYRVGGSKVIEVDVRIIAATNKDLVREVEAGNFRGDLYYRLNVLALRLPPLRERKLDIPLLADYFARSKAAKLNKRPLQINEQLRRRFLDYNWPGNIRELENVIESMLSSPDTVQFPPRVQPIGARCAELEVEDLATAELNHIHQVLAKYNGNITAAARALGIGRTTLYRKLQLDCSNMEQ